MYAWSFNPEGERFYGEFKTFNEAVEDAREQAKDYGYGKSIPVYIGKTEHYCPSPECFDVIESIRDDLDSQCDDMDWYLYDVSEKKEDELKDIRILRGESMREIKFRGMKDNDKGEWVYGYLTKTKHDYLIGENQDFMYFVKPETVGQFTGLHDCKGNPIYEGDILEICGQGINLPVKFRHGAFVAMKEQYGIKICEQDEVIGNIYDNPEFVKGE